MTKSERELTMEDYEVLCGIEEEFLIINNDGTLARAADDIMIESARILERDPSFLEKIKVRIRGLDAEPNPAQIEYVTLPLPPSEIGEAIRLGRKILVMAAERLGLKILAQSLHPIQSTPHPIVGTHINISVKRKNMLMTPELMKRVYNYFWNYLPELIALTANSPVYEGGYTGIHSNRIVHSTVLNRNGPALVEVPNEQPALIPIHYYGRRRYKLKIGSGVDEFSKKVVMNEKGHRLMDITARGPSTNLSEDKDASPTLNRIEIRIVDVQPQEQYLIDLTHLCAGSALEAVLEPEDKFPLDPYHEDNIMRALKDGIHANFLNSSSKKPTALESIEDWIVRTEKYRDFLGIEIGDIIGQAKNKPDQQPINIDYQTKQFEMLRQAGKVYVMVQFNRTRIVKDKMGNKYKVPKGAKVEGTISVEYILNYEEDENKIVKSFTDLTAINTLNVKGLEIPLESGDKILNAMNENDYLMRRLFGNFPFFW